MHIILKNQCYSEFLPSIPDKSVHLVLTDPPYLISKKTGFYSVKKGVKRFAISMDFGAWDKKNTNLKNVISHFYRVLKNSGTLIIFYDLWKISYLAKFVKDTGFKQLRIIEWIKTNPVPLNSKVNYLTNAREIAVVAIKGAKPTFNSEYDNGLYYYPIYHHKSRFHPTQKSLKLFESLIQKHTHKNDTVLDCFSGSGTTALACINQKRSFLGNEINQKYYQQSKDILTRRLIS
jgi:DNA modification methylase